MRKLFITLITIAVCCVSSARSNYFCTAGDSSRIVNLLQNARKMPRGTNYMIYFARQLRGIPYVAHTLEIGNKEQLIINMRQMDCTTYVETCTALYICMKQHKYTLAEYISIITKLRYHNGQLINYASRLHYFTEWIENNTAQGFVHEIQSPNPPFKSVQTIKVNYMSTHPQAYKALKTNPSLVPQIRKNENAINNRKYRYIPKSIVGNNAVMKKAVRDGDIIAIITSKKGLDTSHIGIAVWHKDGLHMLNASQVRHVTVEEPMRFADYMQKHPTQTGIRIIRLN